jgi:hypothetical protein
VTVILKEQQQQFGGSPTKNWEQTISMFERVQERECKSTTMEDDLGGSRPRWKTTSMEVDLDESRPRSRS